MLSGKVRVLFIVFMLCGVPLVAQTTFRNGLSFDSLTPGQY